MFLRLLPAPRAALDIYLVCANCLPRQHTKVRVWLVERPRCHLHRIPTYASGLNPVERWRKAQPARSPVRNGS